MSSGEIKRYTTVAITLHWLIAAIILIQYLTGMDFPAPKPWEKYSPKPLLGFHVTMGMAVLILSVARLAWRMFNPAPPHPPGMKKWEVMAANIGHWAFYALIILMPASGWLIQSAHINPKPINAWLVDWPRIPGLQGMTEHTVEVIHDVAVVVHEYLTTWALYVLLALHVGAVVKHHLIDRDPILWKMLPIGKGDELSPFEEMVARWLNPHQR